MCSIDGCGRAVLAKRWCSMHYQRWRVHGDPQMTKYKRHWDGKMCTRCGGNGPFAAGSHACLKCSNKQRRDWNADHLEHRRKYSRDFARESHRKRRRLVLEHYGKRCMCCGETEEAFLTVDHVHGGGNEHRRQLGHGKIVGSSRFYAYLVREGFPAGFQLLCHNCNFAKSHNPGGCPHGKGSTDSVH